MLIPTLNLLYINPKETPKPLNREPLTRLKGDVLWFKVHWVITGWGDWAPKAGSHIDCQLQVCRCRVEARQLDNLYVYIYVHVALVVYLFVSLPYLDQLLWVGCFSYKRPLLGARCQTDTFWAGHVSCSHAHRTPSSYPSFFRLFAPRLGDLRAEDKTRIPWPIPLAYQAMEGSGCSSWRS